MQWSSSANKGKDARETNQHDGDEHFVWVYLVFTTKELMSLESDAKRQQESFGIVLQISVHEPKKKS